MSYLRDTLFNLHLDKSQNCQLRSCYWMKPKVIWYKVKVAATSIISKEPFIVKYLVEKNVWELKSLYKKFSCQKLYALNKDTHTEFVSRVLNHT